MPKHKPKDTESDGELSPLRADGLEAAPFDSSRDLTLEAKRHNTFAGLINMHAISLRSLSGLDSLIDCTHLFINETDDIPAPVFYEELDEFAYTSSYEILNEEGTQILFGLARVKKCCHSVRICPHAYQLYVKDARGTILLTIHGSTGYFGRKRFVRVRHKQETYGILKQEGDCCTPDYLLSNGKDKPLLRICPDGPANCFGTSPVDYGIFNAEFATNIGRVGKEWRWSEINGGRSAVRDVSAANGVIYGAAFPKVLPVTHKILVLATIFTIKFFPSGK